MPADLRRMYASLADDVDATMLPNARSLRVRADRRAHLAAMIACIAAAILVAATAFGANAVLDSAPVGSAGPTVTAPPTTTGPVPTSTPPSTPAASTSTSTRPPAAIPPIPDAAFLVQPAANSSKDTPPYDIQGSDPLPPLCGASVASDSAIGQRRARFFTYFRERYEPAEIPNGTLTQTITVYQPGGAEQAMRDLRTALAGCPSEKIEHFTSHYEPRSATGRGDESVLLLVRNTAPPSDQPMTRTEWYWNLSVARVGDVVTVLFTYGYEGTDADPDVTDDYLRRAVDAIDAWR